MVNPFPQLSAAVKQSGYLSDVFSKWLTSFTNSVNQTPGNSLATTFAKLPVPASGMIFVVTDSTTATWGAVITGGGLNTVGAFYNGTNWTVIAK